MADKQERWEIVEYPGGGVALYENGEHIAGFDNGDDGRLTHVAVNACYQINPSNPMAVAEGLKGLYDACDGCLVGRENWIEAMEQALAAITKPAKKEPVKSHEKCRKSEYNYEKKR